MFVVKLFCFLDGGVGVGELLSNSSIDGSCWSEGFSNNRWIAFAFDRRIEKELVHVTRHGQEHFGVRHVDAQRVQPAEVFRHFRSSGEHHWLREGQRRGPGSVVVLEYGCRSEQRHL